MGTGLAACLNITQPTDGVFHLVLRSVYEFSLASQLTPSLAGQEVGSNEEGRYSFMRSLHTCWLLFHKLL